MDGAPVLLWLVGIRNGKFLWGMSGPLGFAELFGEGFAVVEGYGVEAVENYDVEGEGGDGEGEQEGDHQPGAAEAGGEDEDGVAYGGAGYENCQGDEDAELGGLSAAGFGEIDFFGGGEGAEIAD